MFKGSGNLRYSDFLNIVHNSDKFFSAKQHLLCDKGCYLVNLPDDLVLTIYEIAAAAASQNIIHLQQLSEMSMFEFCTYFDIPKQYMLKPLLFEQHTETYAYHLIGYALVNNLLDNK